MRARSAAASVVRHVGGLAAEALLIAALVAAVALFFSPVYAPAKFLAGTDNAFAGGRQVASIALVAPTGAATTANWPAAGSQVSFSVTANVKASDVYKLWVANQCFQDGTKVYAQYQAVQNWIAGPFTLSWGGGGTASCTAFVFTYPMTATPLSGGTTTYTAW